MRSEAVRLQADDVIGDHQLSGREDDLFSHNEIAGRVAELVAIANTPVHVAVFGAWGTGKSSFLTLTEQRLHEMEGKKVGEREYANKYLVVRYDAWRYGGQALRRDLIAVAARNLNIHRRKYTGGLFESRQVVRLEIDELLRRIGRFVWGVGGALLALALLFGAGVTAYLAAASVLQSLPSLSSLSRRMDLPWGAIAASAAGVAALLNAPNLIGVSVNRSSPSQDDEFAHSLKRLIHEAQVPRVFRFVRYVPPLERWARPKFRRQVVFFIDELDRASDKEVLSTLTALQTQFAGAGVSVVVAADREVLEKALETEQHQSGPERDWSPYLSRPDAFFDKVFQHTFTLPPLRSERVAQYVRELLKDRGGLWADLAAEDVTDDVIYVLIPGHVQSPRRIKVLLNAYATQTRVAEARGLSSRELRSDLAQWCVLQLEFPSFARDVRIEPRLKTLMRSGTKQAGIRGRVMARHQKTPEPAAGAATKEWLDWLERQQLADYLDRVSHLPDPPMELLFLESAGTAIGKFSPEIAVALDRATEFDADATLSWFEGMSSEAKELAARHLAENSRLSISIGMDRLISVMSGLIQDLGPAPLSGLSAFVEALRPYVAGRAIPPQARNGYLRVMLEADHADGIEAAFRDFEEEELSVALTGLLSELIEPEICGRQALQMLALEVSPVATAEHLTLLAEREFWQVLGSCISLDARRWLDLGTTDADSADALVAAAHRCAVDVSAALLTGIRDLLDEGAPAPEYARRIGECGWLTEEDRSHLARAVLTLDVTAEPEEWGPLLTVPPAEKQHLDLLAQKLIARFDVAENVENWDALRTVMERVAEFGATDTLFEEGVAHLAQAVWTAPTGPSRLAHGLRVMELLRELSPGLIGPIALKEMLDAAPLLLADAIPIDPYLELVQFVGRDDPISDLDKLLAATTSGEPMIRALQVRLAIRRLLPDVLPGMTATTIGRKLRVFVDAGANGSLAAPAVVEWFRTSRTDREVLSFLRSSNRVWTEPFVEWFGRATRTQATNVWLHLVNRGYPAPTLSTTGLVQELDGARLEKGLRDLSRSDDADIRDRAVNAVRALPVSRADTRRVAQFVAADIAQRSIAERSAAVRLVSDLPPYRLAPEAKLELAKIPYSAWTRRQDKDVAKRLGIKKRSRRRR